MGSRSTYVRRIEQLESAVIAFGRGVATRLPGPRAAHHRAIELAVDALMGSPLAQTDDVRLIRTLQDVDFHSRHIDRLLDTLPPPMGADMNAALVALAVTLDALERRDGALLDRVDSALERILARAERPLLRDGAAAVPDARLRRVALHVLAVAEAARAVVPATRVRPPAPVG
jgi:hypothetical protein